MLVKNMAIREERRGWVWCLLLPVVYSRDSTAVHHPREKCSEAFELFFGGNKLYDLFAVLKKLLCVSDRKC
jgi:hypothetical protein